MRLSNVGVSVTGPHNRVLREIIFQVVKSYVLQALHVRTTDTKIVTVAMGAERFLW